MTIGKETTYFFGLIQNEWDDLPSGSEFSICSKGVDGRIKVVDHNTLRYNVVSNNQQIETTLVGEEINESNLRIGPSNWRELVVGKSIKIYWDPDLPGDEDKNFTSQAHIKLRMAGI